MEYIIENNGSVHYNELKKIYLTPINEQPPKPKFYQNGDVNHENNKNK